eukprot:scpid61259/ scgid22206/ 
MATGHILEMLTRAQPTDNQVSAMQGTDRLQRFLSLPQTNTTPPDCRRSQTLSRNGVPRRGSAGNGSTVTDEYPHRRYSAPVPSTKTDDTPIVLTNWHVLFTTTPPDPSEFNLIFNNHNLIADDKLSLLSPPQSPQPTPSRTLSSSLASPTTPAGNNTSLPEDSRAYRSPSDTHSSGDIHVEIVRLPSTLSHSSHQSHY